MLMYNLIEYDNNSSKLSGNLLQCCQDIPTDSDIDEGDIV